jgi:putative methyltransferase (TIGR04325 family)
MNQLKSFIKDWLPPAILRGLRRTNSHSIYFEGSYNTWEEASALCGGYDDKSILEKVLNSTLKVKRGEAAYERDSVVFNEPDYVWPVTTALMWAAAKSGGKLHVLDFGGSLGSTYFQNRAFLKDISELRWSVVEQPNYVQAGREFIEDEHIQFYEKINHLTLYRLPNVVLFSSVLQYLPEPEMVIRDTTELNPSVIIIDKTIVNHSNADSIYIQKVPSSIYRAAYPCRSLSENNLLNHFTSNFQLLKKFPSLPFPALMQIQSEFVGYILTSN